MCLSALLQSNSKTDDEVAEPKRLLLLLATQNADKAAVPAAFEHRLAMMGAFAGDLKKTLSTLSYAKSIPPFSDSYERGKRRGEDVLADGTKKQGSSDGRKRIEARGELGGRAVKALDDAALTEKAIVGEEQVNEDVIIDIGITKEAMFIEKAKVIEESGLYVHPLQEEGEVEQVHLTGYDTLVRLVAPKYYPPQHSLAPLEGLFNKHKVRVTMRTPPPVEDQQFFFEELKDGAKEQHGWKREWAEKIELVEGRREGDEAISSTSARQCFQNLDLRKKQGNKWCSKSVTSYILGESLYLAEETAGGKAI